MPPRFGKVLSAVVAVLIAQPTLQAFSETQSEWLERTKEMMRRLDLPPDPALEKPVAEAFKRHSACMVENMKAAFKAGKKASDQMTAFACKACDRTLVSREKLFFRANSHRYMEPNLDQDIEKARKECPTALGSATLSWDIASLLDADPKENQSAPVTVAQAGSWTITGEVRYSGELVFKAAVVERSNPAIRLEVICKPASKETFYGWLSYPLKPGLQKTKSFVTFSTDKNSPDQFSADIREDGFVATELFFKVVSPVPYRDKEVLFVSVQGKKLIFDVAGAPVANMNLVDRCHL